MSGIGRLKKNLVKQQFNQLIEDLSLNFIGMKQILQAVVDFLHGKKAIIGGLVSVISTFLLSQGVITANEAILITGLLSVLGISADVATVKLGVSPDRTMGAKPNVPSDVAASDQK